MYLEFYNLKEKPFQITCDPKYLWLGEKHKEALATLRYGIMDDRGFVLLTGEVGTGKTLLVNKLLTLLPEDTVVGNLSVTELDSVDFCKLLVNCFHFPSPFESKAEFLIQMNTYLHKCSSNNQRVVLIIDEAQGLGYHVLEDIRTLSNIEFPDKKLISIFLVGQPELNQTIMTEGNRALAQRFTSRYHIEPLDCDETTSYILHRLDMAGSSQIIFKEDAMQKIFEYTAGIPRLINILCDHALLTGSAYDLLELDADIIEECAHELRIPAREVISGSLRYVTETRESATNPVDPTPSTSRKNTTIKMADGATSVYSHVHMLQRLSMAKWVPQGVVLSLLLFLALGLMGVIDKTTVHSSRDVSIEHTQMDTSEKQVPANGDNSLKKLGQLTQLPVQQTDPVLIVSDNAAAPGWPKEKNIPICLSPTHQIAAQSMAAIDQVASDLMKYPERLVYIHGLSDGAGSPEHRLAVWHKRVDAVKSHLIGKGVPTGQIALAGMDTLAMKAAANRNANHHAMMELPQYEYSKVYNQDK